MRSQPLLTLGKQLLVLSRPITLLLYECSHLLLQAAPVGIPSFSLVEQMQTIGRQTLLMQLLSLIHI